PSATTDLTSVLDSAASSFNAPPTSYIYTLSLHDALPIYLGGLANLAGVTAHGRAVGTQLGLLRVDVFVFFTRGAHVLGNVHDDGTGTAGLGDVERLLQGLGNFRRVLDDEALLHDRPGDRSEEHTSELQSREKL